MKKIILCILLCFVFTLHAEENSLGIGSMAYSNQSNYEKFKNSFYFFWAPLTLAHSQLSSASGNYQSNYSSTNMDGFGLGVRHNLAVLNNKFGLMGDYNLSAYWKQGTESSKNNVQLSSSSSYVNLLAFDITMKGLLSYTFKDNFALFAGGVISYVASRAQTTIGDGDNAYNELHYGPDFGFQIINLPIQNLFVSLEWMQYIKQKESASRIFSDGAKEQLSVGINF